MLKQAVLFKISLFMFFFPGAVTATEPMKGDSKHVAVWNKFANDSLSLHKKLTAGENIEVKTRVGSYANVKDFYVEHRYYNDGRLISQLQWEKDNPESLHTIEVYVHDEQGRVIRDYTAAYLPFYRNAPTQTLISIHHYNDDLHAFRSFDASGDTVLERCQGEDSNGEAVNLLLDEEDLIYDNDGIMATSDYKKCFSGLKQDKLGKYIIPH